MQHQVGWRLRQGPDGHRRVAVPHTRGVGSYDGADTGRMASAVTGLYPWIGYKPSERVTVWTVAGYGAGG